MRRLIRERHLRGARHDDAKMAQARGRQNEADSVARGCVQRGNARAAQHIRGGNDQRAVTGGKPDRTAFAQLVHGTLNGQTPGIAKPACQVAASRTNLYVFVRQSRLTQKKNS
jgi:hypothetical protein